MNTELDEMVPAEIVPGQTNYRVLQRGLNKVSRPGLRTTAHSKANSINGSLVRIAPLTQDKSNMRTLFQKQKAIFPLKATQSFSNIKLKVATKSNMASKR